MNQAHPVSKPAPTELVKPAMQDPEGRVVVARDHDQLAIGAYTRVEPEEQPVLGDAGSRDVARSRGPKHTN